VDWAEHTVVHMQQANVGATDLNDRLGVAVEEAIAVVPAVHVA
jgi:hypothetical protein